MHFTGKQRDYETGLDYFDARYYGSNTGRFMSPDWSEEPTPIPYAKLDDPQTLNLYGYVRNNPLSSTDPSGHDGWDVLQGAINAFGSDMLGGAYRTDPGNGDHQLGQAIGDGIATVVGTGEALLGAGGEVAGVALDATGVGALVGVPAGIVSTAAIGQGSAAALIGGAHLAKSAKDANSGGAYENTPENQERKSQGNAPVGKDGNAVELHHEGQAANGKVTEMTRTDHRSGSNFKKNHPNTGQKPSKIDRAKFKKTREKYWKTH